MSTASPRIAMVGNPNCGKTALFNRLTGSRQKVANYAGVTVERKSGRMTTAAGREFDVLDLPGAYSLAAASPDEAITASICAGTHASEAAPDVIVCVVDATNLRLHLRFVLEVARLGRPMIVALNMMDAARRRGIQVDTARLAGELGVPVIETVAVHHEGVAALTAHLDGPAPAPPAARPADEDIHTASRVLMDATVHLSAQGPTLEDRIDAWTLHPVAGPAILAALMFLIFQAVFSWAVPFMNAIDAGVSGIGGAVAGLLPAHSALHSLVADGIVAGVGGVLVFLPQILILFLFILMLEESGYLPRAAFLLDRLMFKVGLTGRAFIPLLSSFACAIPGIMATRSMADSRDRLATILVAPLMTCSARLPVYTLLIAAFIPHRSVLGLFNLQGIVLFGLYLFGIAGAMAVALVMKHVRRDTSDHALLMELPAYRMPNPRDVALGLWQRALIFLKRVGGIIFTVTVLLWFLASFPLPPAGATGPAIQYSVVGFIGHYLHYLLAPLGFNWQICVALVPGMAAREVAVSALGTVYSMSGNPAGISHQLGALIGQQWPLATALSLLAWYVFAPQCISTLAVMRRETNSWRVVLVALTYLFGLAYLASLATYHIAAALGGGI